MATVVKTYTFDANLQGFALYSGPILPPNAGNAVNWQGGDGTPSAGCAECTIPTPDLTWSGEAMVTAVGPTWQDLGVPVNASVTNYQISYSGKIHDPNMVGPNRYTTYSVLLSQDTSVGVSFDSPRNLDTNDVWVAFTQSTYTVPDAYQAYNTPIRVFTQVNNNFRDSSIVARYVRFDNIVITITYTLPPSTMLAGQCYWPAGYFPQYWPL